MIQIPTPLANWHFAIVAPQELAEHSHHTFGLWAFLAVIFLICVAANVLRSR